MTRTESHGSGAQAQRALRYLNEDQLKRPLSQLNTTAMQTLLGAVQRAGSLEEIEIVLRYQQARDPRAWPRELVDPLLKDMKTSAEGHALDRDKVKAAATQLALIARVQRVVEDPERRGGGR